VVTRAVPVAARLAGLPQVDLHVLPGRVGQPTRTAVGAETVAAIERLRADVAFLDVEGLSVGHGLSTDDHDEAAVRGAAVAVARRVVCLGYSSSIGVERPVRFARVDDVDVLVTDDGLPAPDRAALEAAGPEVVVA
jgi:DeoR family fructose operon transcriptional repressor